MNLEKEAGGMAAEAGPRGRTAPALVQCHANRVNRRLGHRTHARPSQTQSLDEPVAKWIGDTRSRLGTPAPPRPRSGGRGGIRHGRMLGSRVGDAEQRQGGGIEALRNRAIAHACRLESDFEALVGDLGPKSILIGLRWIVGSRKCCSLQDKEKRCGRRRFLSTRTSGRRGFSAT